MTSPTAASPRALRLADWGVIRASGADAAAFLHGQLTQDFALLDGEHARLAGYCTAKGRLLATMVGWKQGEHILLALPAELLPATLKRLSMFVMRAKCKLSDASAELALYGLLGMSEAEPWALLQAPDGSGAVQIALPGPGRRLLAQAADAAPPALPALSADDWAWAEVEAGMAWVRSATVEAFVPQMINLEALGGVNFKKGCYPGQEVVARSQYRGTIKRRLMIFATDAEAAVGQELFWSEDPEQPAGLVAGVARRGERSLLVAEIKLATLEAGHLQLGGAGGPRLSLIGLPYDIQAQD